MNEAFNSLKPFPKLDAWFLWLEKQPANQKRLPWEMVCFYICKSLNQGFNQDAFEKSFQSLLLDPSYTSEVYQQSLQFLHARDFSFMNYLSFACQASIRQGRENIIFKYLCDAADQSGEIVFYFLSAWMALNSDHHELCIAQVNKVKNKTSELYSIKGQAHLELGEIKLAIENLGKAVELNKEDTLTLYQLSKTYLIAGDYLKSWNALRLCENLQGPHPEIALMYAFIAIDGDLKELNYLHHAFISLLPYLNSHADHEDVVCKLLLLSIFLNKKDDFYFIASQAKWKELTQSRKFYKSYAKVLKLLGEKMWFDMAEKILSVNLEKTLPAHPA